MDVKEYAASWKRQKKDNMKSLSPIRYADDFVIIYEKLEVVQHCCGLIFANLVREMGLTCNPEKTKIGHTLHEHEGNKPGFNFLGFNIRQYPVGKHHSGKKPNGETLGFKTIIKPSKEKVKEHYRKLVEIVDKHKAATQHALIAKLALVIKG